MFHVRQENLPFVGSSHEFVGAEQGNTGVSVFLFYGKPGSGPGPHRHPYDEIQFIREGRGVWTVSGKLAFDFYQPSQSGLIDSANRGRLMRQSRGFIHALPFLPATCPLI